MVVVLTTKSECSRADEKRLSHLVAEKMMAGMSYDQAAKAVKEAEAKPQPAPARSSPKAMTIRLRAANFKTLKAEARRRRMGANDLAEKLLQVVVEDGLFTAILGK